MSSYRVTFLVMMSPIALVGGYVVFSLQQGLMITVRNGQHVAVMLYVVSLNRPNVLLMYIVL